MAYYICSFRSGQDDAASLFLRSIISQFVKQSRGLVGYIYDDMLIKGLSPSKGNLKKLLLNLLPGTPSAQIIIDGLDECGPDAQKEIAAIVTSLNGIGTFTTACNVLIVSREVDIIERAFRKYPRISLKDESHAVDAAIKLYIQQEMSDIRDNLDDTYVPADFLDWLKEQLLSKAGGKNSHHPTAQFIGNNVHCRDVSLGAPHAHHLSRSAQRVGPGASSEESSRRT